MYYYFRKGDIAHVLRDEAPLSRVYLFILKGRSIISILYVWEGENRPLAIMRA